MPEADTELLLERAAAGDADARNGLLQRHRDRLKRMVAVRADPRLAARVDPSDVVQETLTEAARKLDGYLLDRPLPFYPWLRELAKERIAALHRRHVQAKRRSVTREEKPIGLPDESAMALADRLFARGSSPSAGLHREERRVRVRKALGDLPDRDRELLVLRHLEGLSAREIAEVLGTTEGAVHKRHVRALHQLRQRLGTEFREGE